MWYRQFIIYLCTWLWWYIYIYIYRQSQEQTNFVNLSANNTISLCFTLLQTHGFLWKVGHLSQSRQFIISFSKTFETYSASSHITISEESAEILKYVCSLAHNVCSKGTYFDCLKWKIQYIQIQWCQIIFYTKYSKWYSAIVLFTLSA